MDTQVTAAVVHVPQALTPDQLTPADLAAFADLGITSDLLALAHVQRVTNREARDRFGIMGSATQDMSGVVFPYFDQHFRRRRTARVRRDNPEFEDGKPKNKYISAYGDRKCLYFPPGAARKLEDKHTPIVLVEAEKSSLALTAFAERMGRKLLPIGMGGCWGWKGRIGRVINEKGQRVDEKGPITDLHCCDARTVYVLLDANANSNPNVHQAQRALVAELKSRNCEVNVCQLPVIDGVNGPDDYIAVCGDEAMASVLDGARPAVVSFEYASGHFELTDRGVYYIEGNAEGENLKPPLWICSPLSMSAKTRSKESRNWGRLLTWRDSDGVPHQWAMPAELLKGDGTDVIGELLYQGLTISPSKRARTLLTAYIQVRPVDARARCVDRLGWHGPVYVLPDRVIGHAHEQVVFQNAHAVEPAFSVSGTVEQWRDNIAALSQRNSRLVFAISAALASALLDPAGEQSGGFHFRGPSSTGKTTALQIAASVWGDPDEYRRTWRATTNGLEAQAALHNDNLLVIDELGQADPRAAGEAAYLLANGQGKARASRNGTARPSATWQLLYLSAGEESLSALMGQAGRKPTAGQEIRLAEIDADAGLNMGILEEVHAYQSPGALILALKDAAKSFHGAVGNEWIRLLVKDRANLADLIADGVRQFSGEYVPEGSTGQVVRVARRFGLVAVAGEMATHYGLTGWDEGEATRGVGKCFISWLDLFGGTGNREERALLKQVKAFFELHGASRFQSQESERIINRAGFVREAEDGTREYLVLPEMCRNEICAGYPFRWAVKALQSNGWIVPGSDGRPTQKPRLPGIGTHRVYVFGARLWEEGEE